MKRISHICLLTIILAALTVSFLIPFAMAEGAEEPVYKADLTEEDYIGKWTLKSMIMQGYPVPTEQLGLHATIIVKAGKIEITDVTGSTNEYVTTFEDGMIRFMIGDEQMVVYITPEGLLHVDQAVQVFVGTTEDEGVPEVQGETLSFENLDNSFLTQYFEKVEE